MEYCVQAWSPYLKKDTECLEKVQEQTGQVLAKIWALKAWLNQPIIRQVQVQIAAVRDRSGQRHVVIRGTRINTDLLTY